MHALVYHYFDEREFRTGKMKENHASYPVWSILDAFIVLLDTKWNSPDYFPNSSLYQDWEDVHAAYRQTMIDKWNNDKKTPTWTNRGMPDWAYEYLI